MKALSSFNFHLSTLPTVVSILPLLRCRGWQRHEKTAPLKDYYANQGKLVTVEGQEEVAETSKLTLAAVGVE